MWALGLALLLVSYGDDEAAKPAVDLSARLKVPGVFALQTRARQPDAAGIEQVVEGQARWQASETAIVVCDMWDRHWCAGASRRVGIMAPRMNEVLDAARQRGVFIVHAPSDTITFYEGTCPRRRLQEAPAAQPPVAIAGWCRLDPEAEGPLADRRRRRRLRLLAHLPELQGLEPPASRARRGARRRRLGQRR